MTEAEIENMLQNWDNWDVSDDECEVELEDEGDNPSASTSNDILSLSAFIVDEEIAGNKNIM